jgi:thymidine kinase
VGIDEAQFFDNELVEVCNELARRGVRVIIAGLDMDFRCQPFGPMPALMAVADSVTKVHAICVKCGNLAYVSHRLVDGEKQVLLGEKMEYEPLCRECYNKAKSEAAKAAIDAAQKVELIPLNRIGLTISYALYATARKYLDSVGFTSENEEFAAEIKISGTIPRAASQDVDKFIQELGNGKIICTQQEL